MVLLSHNIYVDSVEYWDNKLFNVQLFDDFYLLFIFKLCEKSKIKTSFLK